MQTSPAKMMLSWDTLTQSILMNRMSDDGGEEVWNHWEPLGSISLQTWAFFFDGYTMLYSFFTIPRIWYCKFKTPKTSLTHRFKNSDRSKNSTENSTKTWYQQLGQDHVAGEKPPVNLVHFQPHSHAGHGRLSRGTQPGAYQLRCKGLGYPWNNMAMDQYLWK